MEGPRKEGRGEWVLAFQVGNQSQAESAEPRMHRGRGLERQRSMALSIAKLLAFEGE